MQAAIRDVKGTVSFADQFPTGADRRPRRRLPAGAGRPEGAHAMRRTTLLLILPLLVSLLGCQTKAHPPAAVGGPARRQRRRPRCSHSPLRRISLSMNRGVVGWANSSGI